MFEPKKINDAGEILGTSFDGKSGPYPGVYRHGVVHDLFHSGVVANAADMNNAGQIICYIFADSSTYPGLVPPHGHDINLTNVFEDLLLPLAINDQGDILGIGARDGIFSTTTGRIEPIENFPANMIAMNNSDQVVGSIYSRELPSSVGALRDGNHIEIFSYPGKDYTTFNIINNRGQIAGYAFSWLVLDGNYFFSPTAFLYQGGRATPLGTLPGDAASLGYGMNDSGEVVGWSSPALSYSVRAIVYRNQRMYDLNSLIPANSGWNLQWATSINNQGQIVGNGIFRGQQQGFLLTPIPQ